MGRTPSIYNVIEFEKSAHWYTKEGKSQHDADLRVARKLNLYPSVTSIEKDVFKNAQLEKYKLTKLAQAAAGTFRQAHESEKDYCNRIYEMSRQHSIDAADFGKEVHDAIEHYPNYPLNQTLMPWVLKFGEWYDREILEVTHREKVILDHDIGIAGRIDFIGKNKSNEIVIPDWKTQGVKKNESGKKIPMFYSSWSRQLAAYAVAYAKEIGMFPALPKCMSVVIDSEEPSAPYVKVWSDEEIRQAYQTFTMSAWLWFSGMGNRKPYWPQPNGPFSVNFSIPMP